MFMASFLKVAIIAIAINIYFNKGGQCADPGIGV
jgi:hypothetical protein